jgi:NADH dehydrogenase
VDVTLVDRNNFHTFLPLLYQVAAAELEPFAIAQPVRTLMRGQANLQFLHATAMRVDPAGKIVHTDRGVYAYDYLIIATGTVAFDFGVRGARTHAFPLKTLEDGITLRSHILSRFEAATHEPDGARRRSALRFVVVGGGPTGVEFAGAVSELVRGPLARDYPGVAGEASILLVEAADRLLLAFPPGLGAYALRRLERMNVEVRLGARVDEVGEDRVVFGSGEDGDEVECETVAWTAGVQASAETEGWSLPLSRDRRIRVGPTLQVEGYPEIFAIGDVASVETGDPPPMLAQAAMQGGVHAARGIVAIEKGAEPDQFRYHDKGIMAVIGRNAAAARIRGRSFTGFPAWLLWLGIHIAYLIGFRNRLAVLLNWAWDYVFFERSARILIPLRVRRPRWPATDVEGPSGWRAGGCPVRAGPSPTDPRSPASSRDCPARTSSDRPVC